MQRVFWSGRVRACPHRRRGSELHFLLKMGSSFVVKILQDLITDFGSVFLLTKYNLDAKFVRQVHKLYAYHMQAWPLRRVHISWIIAGLSLGITVAIIASPHLVNGAFLGNAWLAIGLVLLVPIFRKPKNWMMTLAILGGFIIGAWRGDMGKSGLSDYKKLIGHNVVLDGKISEDPDIDKSGKTVLRLVDISVQGHKLPGNVWVVLADNPSVQRSDLVEVKGKMSEGFGSFASSIYRANTISVERPTPGDVAVDVRNVFAERVRSRISEPESSLGLGFLLGLRRALPQELSDILKIAGLTHIIVASGYNLTILVRLSRRLFVRRSKYLAMISSGAMIVGFMAITGLSPSMSRAGLVSGLSLLAWYYGRKIHPLVLIPLAAAITLMINPQYGWNDLGWQLSFASFAGVVILAPLLQRYFFGKKEPGIFRQILGETLSAQLMALPIIVIAFGMFSNVALIANLLILPLVPLAMLMTFLTGLLAGIPILGAALGTVTGWILHYMIEIAKWLASQSWAQTEIHIGWLAGVIVYLLIGLACLYMWRKTKFDMKSVNIVK